MHIRYNSSDKIFNEREKDGVSFLTFRLFDDLPFVSHAFSTRLGGVSEGPYTSMNLSFTQGDLRENVLENFRLMGNAIGVGPDRMVTAMQTHTTNIRRVSEDDPGKGVIRPLDYEDVDGLITDIPGICLVTGYADCVPLYFVDKKRRAIGLSHSGWKGTVGQMGKKTVEAMTDAFGSDPADILAAIGPSICQSCYEVSEDVIDNFREAYPEEAHGSIFSDQASFYKEHGNAASPKDGKYQLNLQAACRLTLLSAGVLPEHIAVTNACTCCNPEVFHSHRAAKGGPRGNLCAFLMLKKA